MIKGDLEQETISFEREKWEAENSFREREITVKEAELKLKSKEMANSGWRNPLVIAIIAATIAAIGNAVIAVVNGTLQRQLEDRKSEQTRILEMIKTGDADKAADNLEFLLKAGLINDQEQASKLNDFLVKRAPGSGPTLPTGSLSDAFNRAASGTDDATPTEVLPSNTTIRTSAMAVGRLYGIKGGVGARITCTAFLVGNSTALTSGHCIDEMTSAQLMMLDRGREVSYEVTLPPIEINSNVDGLNYALLNIKGSPGSKYGVLSLASKSPEKDQALSVVMFREPKRQLVVIGASDCHVTEIEKDVFHHGCDTGAGTTGAPILTGDGSQVVGIHFRRSPSGGVAVRGDMLLNVSKILKRGM